MHCEADLLLACTRRFIGTDPAELHEALGTHLNWPSLSELADAHSVTPLLYWALEQECPDRIPQQLRVRFETRARTNLMQTAELLKILKLFEQDGIPTIALKGPVLAQWGYGDLALREFSDLDLLVRREQVAVAKNVLIRAGYRLRSGLHCSSPSALLRSKDGELIFESETRGINVDLHWRLFPDYFPESLDPEELWENLTSVSLGGRAVPTLSPENTLLFLAAHGGKHRWECLVWICDLAVVLNRTIIDWNRLLARARQAHIERMLLVGLQLASGVLGAELPHEVLRLARADPDVTKLAKAVQARILENSPIQASATEACRMNLRMLERFRDKLRFLTGILITPGEAEWRDLRLPPTFYKLYYPYRLLRLIGKHSATPLRSFL